MKDIISDIKVANVVQCHINWRNDRKGSYRDDWVSKKSDCYNRLTETEQSKAIALMNQYDRDNNVFAQ